MTDSSSGGSGDFDFSIGDRVLVRIREDGRQVAKFEAGVLDFKTVGAGLGSDKVLLSPPWSKNHVGSMTLRPYEAEFEVIEQ